MGSPALCNSKFCKYKAIIYMQIEAAAISKLFDSNSHFCVNAFAGVTTGRNCRLVISEWSVKNSLGV